MINAPDEEPLAKRAYERPQLRAIGANHADGKQFSAAGEVTVGPYEYSPMGTDTPMGS